MIPSFFKKTLSGYSLLKTTIVYYIAYAPA